MKNKFLVADRADWLAALHVVAFAHIEAGHGAANAGAGRDDTDAFDSGKNSLFLGELPHCNGQGLRACNRRNRQERRGSSVRTVAAPTDQIFAVAADLVQDDGQSFSCGVCDGDTVDVDAVLDGRLISVDANNPWLCQNRDAGSRR